MKTLKLIIFLLLVIVFPLLAIDTLNCIANYEFQTPMEESEFMSVRALGDLNADGYDDWAYIFYDRNPYYPDDTIWVFFGNDTVDFTCDYKLRARDIASIGDVNNDGYTDIAYLEVEISNLHIMGYPQLYVLHGGPAFDFIPDDTCTVMAGGQGVVFSPIGTVGDINNDGYDDIYSGVSFQINSTGTAKQYIHFGADNISEMPDMVICPPSRIDTVVMGEYEWGWCYAPMGDLDDDGYDDFAIMYGGAPPWSEDSRVVYLYKGAADPDSIISSVDTLVEGFYTDFYQMGNINDSENNLMLYTQYYDLMDIYSIEHPETLIHMSKAYECTQSNGDINNDGYNDWFIHFRDPKFYQGYFGGTLLDTIVDIVLPAEDQPQARYPQYIYSTFVGDICGDGYDKLLFIESNSNMYHVFCYSYNEVLTNIKTQNPEAFQLSQNYPNPFNPTTTIDYAIPEASDVKLSIYDISGHLVETLVDELNQAGTHKVKWDASKYSSGIYIYRLESSHGIHSRKMVLIK